jgi:hypothetical protein
MATIAAAAAFATVAAVATAATAATTAVVMSVIAEKEKEDDKILDMVASRPLPGMVSPSSILFSPDSSYLTFLSAPNASESAAILGSSSSSSSDNNDAAAVASKAALTQQLYYIQLKSSSSISPSSLNREVLVSTQDAPKLISEEELSLEEKLRRERQRNLNLGITSYSWGTTRIAAEDGEKKTKKINVVLIPLGGDIYVKFDGKKELVLAYDHAMTPDPDQVQTDQDPIPPGPCIDGMFFFFLKFCHYLKK